MSEHSVPDECASSSEEVLELIAQLRDERGTYRLSAAQRLKSVGDASAVEPLCAALSDQNPDVRTSAARALLVIGDERAVDPLCAALKDSYRDTRICAAEALGRISDARAVDPLCGLFTDTYQDVRAAAADALVKIGQPSVVRLCELLTDTDQERLAAGNYPAQKSGAKLDAKLPLRDVKRSARRFAALALGRIGDAGSVGSLCIALKDADCSVRKAAAASLHKIGDASAIESLCCALEDTDLQVRSGAARALVAMKHLLAVEPLCRLIARGDRAVRSAALDTLHQIGNVYTLPMSVLTYRALTSAQKLDALQALSAVRSNFSRKVLRAGDVRAFCQGLCDVDGIDEEVKLAAAAILTEIKNRSVSTELVRASERSDKGASDDLLRAAVGFAGNSDPTQLMRASDANQEPGANKKPGVLGRLFKKQ